MGGVLFNAVGRRVEFSPEPHPARLQAVDHVAVAPDDWCQLLNVRKNAFRGRRAFGPPRDLVAELIGKAQQELDARHASLGEISLKRGDFRVRDRSVGELGQVAVGLGYGHAVLDESRKRPLVRDVRELDGIFGLPSDADLEAPAAFGIGETVPRIGGGESVKGNRRSQKEGNDVHARG